MRFVLYLACLSVLGGCASPGKPQSPLIPDQVLVIAPGPGGSLSAGAATTIGIAYMVYDPLAPNWVIQERKLAANTYQFSLEMKRFNTGGDGDALTIAKRRALALQQAAGMGSYRFLSFEQGLIHRRLGLGVLRRQRWCCSQWCIPRPNQNRRRFLN